MSVEGANSTDEHNHSVDCGCHQSWFRTSLALPLEPLRWLVLGCVGLVGIGLVLPFSPIPPCPMLALTGVPCPFCGMTRSVRALARLDVMQSIRFQPFGSSALVGGLLVMLLWAIPKTRQIAVIRIPVVVLGVMLFASWVWNVGFNPTFT